MQCFVLTEIAVFNEETNTNLRNKNELCLVVKAKAPPFLNNLACPPVQIEMEWVFFSLTIAGFSFPPSHSSGMLQDLILITLPASLKSDSESNPHWDLLSFSLDSPLPKRRNCQNRVYAVSTNICHPYFRVDYVLLETYQAMLWFSYAKL